MSAARLARAVLAASVLAACGSPATPPSPIATRPVTPPPAPKEPDAGPALPAVAYEAKGRRDPFTPPAAPEGNKSGMTLSTVKLVGVVHGRQQVLALVEGSDGIGYILKNGDTLADGKVTGITSTSVSFLIPAKAGQAENTVTLRLKTD
jgi:Tfp pilus assembly protein PilP